MSENHFYVAAADYNEEEHGDILKATDCVTRASSDYERYKDLERNISVRNQYSRLDYEYFRPSESVPKRDREIKIVCNNAYKKVGLIRNVIDLMGDFTVQGIRIVHRNESAQKVYQQWWQKVQGVDRSERMANILYRLASVPIQRKSIKVNPVQIKQIQQTLAAEELSDTLPVGAQDLPVGYTFLNPCQLTVVGENLGIIGNTRLYEMDVTLRLRKMIQNPASEAEREFVKLLPQQFIAKVRGNATRILLDPENTKVLSYKIDDWEAWATPIIYSILDDIILLEKLKLSDLTALDGAISHIRLWKLGDIKEHIIPTAAALQRLKALLTGNVGGGSMDLVWGPDIQLQETSTDITKHLGMTKYEPVLSSIYAGLGIPPTLTGVGTSSGFTNNFISLKTLVERLNYGRQIIKHFWAEELRMVQRAMGFRYPAEIVFDNNLLTDENTYKALLRDLLDRGVLSEDTIRERFGEINEVEKQRISRQEKMRESGRLPDKAGPFHNPNTDNELRKIALQKGFTPAEVGLELDEKEPGEPSLIETQVKQMKMKPLGSGVKGQPGQGRPKNSPDRTKRKKKPYTPRTTAELLDINVWARKALSSIDKIVTPIYLEAIDKKNLRTLTDEEVNEHEQLKFAILCQLEPKSPITAEAVYSMMSNDNLTIPGEIYSLYKEWLKDNPKPTVEDDRQAQIAAYATLV